MVCLLPKPFDTLYVAAQRKKAFRLVFLGFQEAQPKCHPKMQEPSITGLIAAALEKILRDPLSPKWMDKVSVKENPPQNDGIALGKKRRMPDLVIEFMFKGRPEYIFEAKRLSRPNNHLSKYLGAEGLACFLDGSYAARYPEAGMLAYVQTDTPNWWCAQLTQRVPLTDCALDPEVSIYKSCHQREDGRLLEVFHALLDCTLGA